MDAFFDELHSLLAPASRDTFARLCSAHGEEGIYAFALTTDDGAMSVGAAANTRAAFAELGRQDHAVKWSPDEWAYQDVGDEALQPCCDLLAEKVFAVEDRDFPAFKRRLQQLLVDVLGELEQEGVFGTGAARESLVVFAYVTDSSAGKKLRLSSAQSLNPAGALKGFLAG